jgi:5-methyltetrahydrofolate--homocysteine methyltransferase
MAEHNIIDFLATRPLVADGATGSNLQQRGLEKGEPGERWVLDNPDGIKKLYSDFICAGSDIILSCTFGASEYLLKQHDIFDQQTAIVAKAVVLAKEAIGNKTVFVAGSMGPLGQLMQPLGLLSEENAYGAYYNLATLLDQAGVDFLLIETQFDIAEATVAIKACQEASSLPVICSFSFDRGTRTMMGVKPEIFAKEISAKGVMAVGINCGKNIDQNLEVLSIVKENTDLPIWFKPNAVLPEVDSNGDTVYKTTPEDMQEMAVQALARGANIIGGCCGTTPDHVKAIASAVKKNV